MLIRLLTVFCCSLAMTATASAQFGKPQPTPKSADEHFAERAMRDAGLLTTGIEGREVIRESDGINLARAERRMEQALEIFDRLCADRSLPQDQWARNCFEAGEMHRRGTGTVQDYPKAKARYDAACFDGRHAGACMQQAYVAQKDNAGEIDLEYARRLYEQGCSLRDPGSCAGLGNMMYMGLGGLRDRSRAVELLQDACSDEYEWACTRLVEYGLPARLDRY